MILFCVNLACIICAGLMIKVRAFAREPSRARALEREAASSIEYSRLTRPSRPMRARAREQYMEKRVFPYVDESLEDPMSACRNYMLSVILALLFYYVVATFTLLNRTVRRDGVSAWYGYVIGATFHMIWIMIAQGMFVQGFHPQFKAIDAAIPADTVYSSSDSDRSLALTGLSFTSASLNVVLFLVLLFKRDSICGETAPRPAQVSRTASRADANMRSSRFRVTPLSDDAASPVSSSHVVEIGGESPSSGGSSSLRFGGDRFST